MKWYSFEVYSEIIKDELRKYLKKNNIYYELSGCFDGWHFEIKMSDEQKKNVNENINEFLNSIDKIGF